MAVGARYFIDTSALARLRYPEVDAVLSPLILRGDVVTWALLDLEILYSARSHAELVETRALRSRSLQMIGTEQSDFDRATEVMFELARRGRHRAVGVSDLITAAVAERAGVTIIHYDGDFEYVSEVTGQAVQWVVPRGSVP